MNESPKLLATARATHVELASDDVVLDGLVVRRIVGHEVVSQLPRWDVELVSSRHSSLVPEDAERVARELLAARVRLVFRDASGAVVRTVFGMISTCRREAGKHRDRAVLEVVVVPRVWQLAMILTQETFMDQSVPEIIRTKLERVGLGHAVDFRLVRDYPKRELVVQYKETDLAFVSRLAEHVGISMFFETGEDEERVVFGDHPGAFSAAVETAFIPHGDAIGVTQIAETATVVPAVHAVDDYNYRRPLLDLGAASEIDGVGGVVEYGAHHKSPEEGAALARIRADEARGMGVRFTARAHLAEVAAGTCLRLDRAPAGFPDDLVVIEARHSLTVSIFDGDLGAAHVVDLVAVSRAHDYRPPRITPRPSIHGVVTAVVEARPEDAASSSGQGALARLDAEGRYIIAFHFDQAERNGGVTSRPVRMAQPFAGPNQGMHFPLRPGTEVLVAFVDGDPDRPIIVGAVPNPTTPSRVDASDSHMHRIRSHHGLVIEFGRSQRPSP